MESLRPEQKKEKCTVTFFLGLFSACSIALLVSVVFLLRSRKVVDNKSTTSFLEMIFPLYWLYAYIIFHMVLYALNVYLWRRFGINYTLIFGFKQGTELGFREVLSLSVGLVVLTLSTFLAHLHLKIDSRDTRYAKYIDLITLALVIVVLFITFMPVNILYWSSRFFFIRTLYRCICAPLYKVTFSDFFLADHLTSQIEAIRSCEVYICYFSFLEYYDFLSSKCHRNDVFNIFHLIIAIIPYWIRFLQCLRRFFKEKDATQGYNGLRYLLTVAALLVRTAFEAWKGNAWKGNGGG